MLNAERPGTLRAVRKEVGSDAAICHQPRGKCSRRAANRS